MSSDRHNLSSLRPGLEHVHGTEAGQSVWPGTPFPWVLSLKAVGESVVGSRVAPDRIILAKSSLAVVARTPGGHAAGAAMVLDDRTAQELAFLSQRVEEYLTGPLDIEWARGELELMNPRWCETPDVVLALVRHYLEAIVRNLAVPATRLTELAEQRAAWERECLHRLKNPCERVLFRKALDCARRGIAIKENVKSTWVQNLCHARLLLLELGRRLTERGLCADRTDVFFLKIEELHSEFLFGTGSGLREITAARRAEHDRNQNLTPPPVVFGSGDPSTWRTESSLPAVEHLEGLAVSPGIATGPARVILKPNSEDRVLPGEILVAPSTDPAWSPYFLTAAGIAIDLGGVLSHGSILAREYGLPAVTNLGSATRSIRSGDLVRVDGNRGRVTVLERASTPGVL